MSVKSIGQLLVEYLQGKSEEQKDPVLKERWNEVLQHALREKEKILSSKERGLK